MKKKARKKSSTNKKKALITFAESFAVMIGCLIFVADQLSKLAVHEFLPRMKHVFQWYPYHGIGVFENIWGIEFSIVHSINRGAAWGIFADFQDWLLLFRAAFIAGLLVYIIFYNRVSKFTLPLAVIIAGALGNVADYFVYGHVIDMFKFVLWGYEFPVFNIADSAIFLGVCSLFTLTLKKESPLKRA